MLQQRVIIAAQNSYPTGPWKEWINAMSADKIESMKSLGNKEQVEHFMGLVEQTNSKY